VFFEHQGGISAYHANATSSMLNPVINSGKIDGVVDPPENWGVINYEKGGCVLHMLRGVLDDDALFWQALRDYLAAHAYGNAESDDFVASVSATVGEDMSWFFTPWLYGTGHPHYEYGWSWKDLGGGQYQVDVIIWQVQTTSLFDLPVDFRVQTTSGSFDFSERVDSLVHEFSFVVTAEPTGLQVDPDDWILDEQFLAPTSVDFGPEAAAAQAFALLPPVPNPVRDLTQIRYFLPHPGRVRVSVHDVAGREIRPLWSGEQQAGSRALWWDGRDESGAPVASGVYWVRLEAPEGMLSEKVVVRR
jgi:hypothetical protein